MSTGENETGLRKIADMPADTLAIAYMTTTIAGYLFLLSGGTRLSRLIKVNLMKDIFNEENENFPRKKDYLRTIILSIFRPGII